MEKVVIIIKLLILITMCSAVTCRFIHKIEDYNRPMPQLVAECRRGCLMKFLNRPINEFIHDECSLKPNCFMCWDYCSMLHIDRKKKFITSLMCSDDVCFAGCKFACSYYRYVLAKPMPRTDFFQ